MHCKLTFHPAKSLSKAATPELPALENITTTHHVTVTGEKTQSDITIPEFNKRSYVVDDCLPFFKPCL